MQRISRTLCLTTLFFAAGAALFFTKAAVIPYKVAYPVLLLSLSLFYLRLKPLIPVGAALLLSAVGDAAGAGGMFIPQMLFFALAHGAYMCYFLPQAQVAPRPFVWPVLTALLLFLFVCIVPRAADPAERAGVAVYGLVIAGMLYSALQYRGAYAARRNHAAYAPRYRSTL